MTVVLEAGHAGHRLEYVRYLVELGAEQGCDVVVVTSPRARASAEWSREIGGLADVVAVTDGVGERVRLGVQVRNLRRALAQPAAAHGGIVIPNADEYLLAVLLLAHRLGRAGLRGLVMRPPAGHRVRERVKRTLMRVVPRLWPRIELIPLVSPLSNEFAPRGVIGDPSGLLDRIDDRSDGPALAKLEGYATWRDGAGPVLGLIGVIDPRKSVVEAIRGVAGAGWRIVIAGAPSSDDYLARTRAAAAEVRERAYLLPRSLEGDEFSALVRSVDAIALLYTNESGSSGLLLHALREGKPVLGYANRVVREVIEREGERAGSIAIGLAPAQLSDALRRITGPSTGPRGLEEIGSAVRAQWCALACGIDRARLLSSSRR